MFFGAFFTALWWARSHSVPALGSLDNALLWPDFKAVWPSMVAGATASPAGIVEPFQTMGPFWLPTINTALLLSSGVTLTIARPAAVQQVSLPVWIPGSYLVREFSKNLQKLHARQGTRGVIVQQLDKCSWQVSADPLAPLVRALESGDSIVIFPEGTRGHGDEPQSFKSGLFKLAQMFPQVVLVPAWINNVQRVMPKGEVVPVPILCSVTFGAPIQLEAGEERRPFLDRARRAVIALGRVIAFGRPGDNDMNNFLRGLTATQQIGALFIAVFGILSIVTVWAFVRNLREHASDDPESEARMLEAKRFWGLLKTSWMMATVFWVGWVLGDTVATVLFAIVGFFALREFITLSPTRRGDHRSLVLAFFVVLPLQFWIVGSKMFDLFTVFIPVYVFLALPVVSALANDPQRFLERNAKLQWGIMVCVYGMSHVPALLLLNFKGFAGKTAFASVSLTLPEAIKAQPDLHARIYAQEVAALRAFAEGAQADRTEAGGTEGLPPFEQTVTVAPALETGKLLSLRRTAFDWSGGAHPNTVAAGILWDKALKRQIGPAELFVRGADLAPLDQALCAAVNA
eukprot:gene15787-33312_t